MHPENTARSVPSPGISRVLPILNALGCLALTALVIAQWRGERSANAQITGLKTEINHARHQAAEQEKRRAALERDIAVLKESIESLQKSAEAATRGLAEKEQAAGQLQTELDAARQQVTAWEQALKSRDDRIRELDTQLSATRKRLDEAIAKLKTAAAR